MHHLTNKTKTQSAPIMPTMLTHNFLKCLLLCLVALGATQMPASASASDEAALIQSMEERLPTLMQLKLKGHVGETNMALVEARGSLEREHRRLLSDENGDRLALYKLVAERLGVSVVTVQRKRAEQIRENSPAGIWIESNSGAWYRE